MMNNDRKFFQDSLRRDIDIKKHISSTFYEQVIKGFSNEMQEFSKKIKNQELENEK